MTRFCEVYTELNPLHLDIEEADVKNENFWTKVSTFLPATMLLAKNAVQKSELDIPESMVHDPNERVSDHEIILRILTDYGKQVKIWFELNFDKISEGISAWSESPETDADFIDDVIDVIHWYQYFLGIKYNQTTRVNDPEDLSDQDYLAGTRKVTLIAIERSLAAWGILMKELPEFEDEIMNFILLLYKSQASILQKFPDAGFFKRPGFDY
jgi:hypothetical protein